MQEQNMRRSAFFWLTISFNDIILKMKGISLNDIGGENMPKKQLDTLTEPMYYTLIALMTPKCGIEITEFGVVEKKEPNYEQASLF